MSLQAEQSAGRRQVGPESLSTGIAGARDPAVTLAPAPQMAPEVQETPRAGVEIADDGLSHPLVQDLMLNPTRWRIWPAVAVLRWLQRKTGREGGWLVYRSHPSLGFAGSEVADVAIEEGHLELTLNAPGLAAAGSPLPASDISRIIADKRNGGALSTWLDGPLDRFMQALEAAQAQTNAPFALMTGGRIEAHMLVADVVGRSATLTAGPEGALYDSRQREPEGAVGLAGLFFGPISASGLAGLFRAFTGLAVRVEEFAGADIVTA